MAAGGAGAARARGRGGVRGLLERGKRPRLRLHLRTHHPGRPSESGLDYLISARIWS